MNTRTSHHRARLLAVTLPLVALSLAGSFAATALAERGESSNSAISPK